MRTFTILTFVLTISTYCCGQDFVTIEIDGYKAEGNFIYGHELCLRNNMTLPTPEIKADNKLLADFLEEKKIYRTWIGVNDMGEEGKFRWINNGKRIETFNWHKNQPDNFFNEDCIEFNKYETIWAWNDLECFNNRFPIVCQPKFDIDIRFLSPRPKTV